MVKVIGTIYSKRNAVGDFEWMIEQPENKDALFIFNDNEEAYIANSDARGIGNAVIRPYQKANPPRSTGVPTGHRFRGNAYGYSELSPSVKHIIDASVQKIKELVKKHGYTTIFYSSDKNGMLGTSIFKVGTDVIEYITEQLLALEDL